MRDWSSYFWIYWISLKLFCTYAKYTLSYLILFSSILVSVVVNLSISLFVNDNPLKAWASFSEESEVEACVVCCASYYVDVPVLDVPIVDVPVVDVSDTSNYSFSFKYVSMFYSILWIWTLCSTIILNNFYFSISRLVTSLAWGCYVVGSSRCFLRAWIYAFCS